MNKYIFDLDNTIYSDKEVNENESLFYQSLKKKPFINNLITQLKDVYLFSNGTQEHVEKTINLMDLNKFFYNKNTLSRDSMNGLMKPDLTVFDMALDRFSLKSNDNIYFFEDNLDNLYTAKVYLNWTTVLIDDEIKIKPDFIDYIFPKIENALLHFVIQKNLKNYF